MSYSTEDSLLNDLLFKIAKYFRERLQPPPSPVSESLSECNIILYKAMNKN